jgi:hypothetical protein
MAERAHVTSVEAIKDFRAYLIVYLSKARPALEEISSDLVRTRIWLQNDQRVYWEGQVRKKTKLLEMAQQSLYSSRISALHDAGTAEKMAVLKAKRALEEAEAKLKMVKYWTREFDNRTEPLAKQLDKLQTLFTQDMVQAAAHLAKTVNTLDAYAGVNAPIATMEPAEGGAQAPAGADGADAPAESSPVPASPAAEGGTP